MRPATWAGNQISRETDGRRPSWRGSSCDISVYQFYHRVPRQFCRTIRELFKSPCATLRIFKERAKNVLVLYSLFFPTGKHNRYLTGVLCSTRFSIFPFGVSSIEKQPENCEKKNTLKQSTRSCFGRIPVRQTFRTRIEAGSY